MDFSIQFGASSGARIEIIPGNGSPETQLAVSVDEQAFFLVEWFIVRLAPHAGFNHYGPNRIASQTWGQILETFEQEAAKLGAPPHPDWVSKQLSSTTTIAKEIKQFAEEFARVQRPWINQFTDVFIFGV